MSSPFIWSPGTANNGLLTPAVTLLSTETLSLGSSAVATSNVTFTNSNTAQGIWSDLFLTFSASIASALSAGANAAGWFLTSPDGGTTFENTVANTPQPRSPDFLIPLPATTINSGAVYRSQGIVRIPALEFKVFLQNNTGQAWPAGNNTVKAGIYAVQY